MPVLCVSRRRRHSGHAPAAAGDTGTRARRTGRRARGPGVSCSASKTKPTEAAKPGRARGCADRVERCHVSDNRRGVRRVHRGRLLSVSLRRSDVHRRARGRTRRRGNRAQARRPRDRHLRRIRPPHAIADGSVVARACSGRSVFRQDLAGPAIHGARLRAGVLRRQLRRCPLPAAPSVTRCARTRSCTSGRSASSSRTCCA